MKNFFLGIISILILGTSQGLIKNGAKSLKTTKYIKTSKIDDLKFFRKSHSVLKPVKILNPPRPYNRDAINELFKIRKKELHLEGLKNGSNGVSKFSDIYTGKILRGGEKFDYDHIISAKTVFDKYKHVLTDKQIAELANMKENIGPTIRDINKSKGKKDLLKWFKNPKNDQIHQVNEDLLINNYKRAEEAVNNRALEMMKFNGF